MVENIYEHVVTWRSQVVSLSWVGLGAVCAFFHYPGFGAETRCSILMLSLSLTNLRHTTTAAGIASDTLRNECNYGNSLGDILSVAICCTLIRTEPVVWWQSFTLRCIFWVHILITDHFSWLNGHTSRAGRWCYTGRPWWLWEPDSTSSSNNSGHLIPLVYLKYSRRTLNAKGRASLHRECEIVGGWLPMHKKRERDCQIMQIFTNAINKWMNLISPGT